MTDDPRPSPGPPTLGEGHDSVRTRPEAAPRWLEVGAVGAALVLAAVGSVGLLLAIHERYTTFLAVLLGLPIAALGTVAFDRGRGPTPSGPAAHRAAVAAVVLALGCGLLYASSPSQHVVVTRDPGSYINTARWLAREGKLDAEARGAAFAGVGDLKFSGAAVYDVGGAYEGADPGSEKAGESGSIEFQFNHLASVALAASFDVGGHRALFRLPAAMSTVSLVLVYAVAVRLTRRPTTSLVAPLLLAASMPFLYVGRTTYSESFASVLLWAAVLVAIGLHRWPRVASGATAGLLLGALVSTRVDALLYVALVFPLAAVSVCVPAEVTLRRSRLLCWGALLGVTGAVGYIGWTDLAEHSGWYAEHLSRQLDQLRTGVAAAAVASLVGALIWWRAAAVRQLAAKARGPVAACAAVALAALLLFGWVVRPEMQISEGDFHFPAVAAIQERDGLPIEPARDYAEHSMRWMSWYLGIPAVAVAFGALVVATWRTISRRAEPAQLGLLVLCLGASGLYWCTPEITPDHPWATRRFVPATFPALAVWATAGLGLIGSLPVAARWARRRPDVVRFGIVIAAALLLLVPPALTTRPVREQRLQGGYLRPVLESCEALPDDAAVVTLGSFASATLANTIRAWCGVPTAATATDLDPSRMTEIARKVAANGYRLHLVSPDRGGLVSFESPGAPPVTSTTGIHNDRTVEQTLDRPPDRYQQPEQVLPVPTPFALHVLELEPQGCSRAEQANC